MARIAIVGVGAIGGVMASALLEGVGIELTLHTRQPFERLRLEAHDNGENTLREHRVSVFSDPEHYGAAARPRWVLLATKAHQSAGAAPWLARLCGDHTTVAVLQNGVEHVERVAPLAGQARVLPAIVDCPATRVGPGHTICYRPPTIILPRGANGDSQELAEVLGNAGIAVEIADDFVTALWRKLCVNVVSGAIPALCDQPRRVFRRPDIELLCRQLIAECMAVGRAEGATLDDGLPDRIMATMQAGNPSSLTSMLVDRRAGKALESNARNGAVARIGARHGIATPLNKAVNTLLAAINPSGDQSE